MQPWLRYELLFFYTRDELEHLQPLAKSLLNMIIKGSRVLPLRPIRRVDMGCDEADDKIRTWLDGGPTDEREPDYEASVLDGDFKETFLRLQNICVKYFSVGIRDSLFFRYWKAQDNAAFTVVRIDVGFNFNYIDDADYDVLDLIVNHLRPRTTEVNVEESSWQENGGELLARDSFLNSLHTCNVMVWENAFPPPAFFLKDPGYPNYQVHSCVGPVADGIDGFVESFVRDGCTNKKLESVCIHWIDGHGPPSPASKQLRKPIKIDMPLPNFDATPWSLPEDNNRVTHCEMHSFINKKQWMRMDVYEWSFLYERRDHLATRHILLCRLIYI